MDFSDFDELWTPFLGLDSADWLPSPPPPEAVDAERSEAGLSTINKVHETNESHINTRFRPDNWTWVYNRQTGKAMGINSNDSRLSRMQKRLYGYSRHLKRGIDCKQLFAKQSRNKGHSGPVTYMTTLTYAPDQKWEPGHITRVTKWLHRRYEHRLLSYAWVAELTGRKCIHYHLMVTLSSGSLKFLDRAQGERDFVPWLWGSTNVQKAKTTHYLSKYIGKEYQKDYRSFPKGCRAFGLWVSDSYSWEVRNNIRLTAFPQWLRERIPSELCDEGKLPIARREGGGWLIEGKLVESPWVFCGVTDNPEEFVSFEWLKLQGHYW